MRVVCQTVEDFLQNLEADVENVFRRIVYINRTERPIGEEGANPRDVVRFEVGIQVSAVINIPREEGQYLLELGCLCGIDYRDQTQEFVGSEEVASQSDRIKQFCAEHELLVRPGTIDM